MGRFLDLRLSMRSAIRTTVVASGSCSSLAMSSISSGARGSALCLLEQTLYQELNDKFLMLRVDAASGVSFYDTADEQELLQVCHLADRITRRGRGSGISRRR